MRRTGNREDTMTPRSTCFPLIGLLLLLGACTRQPSEAPPEAAARKAPERPNIVFILTDDHAWQSIGAYGSRLNETPNIDRIAEEGMRFDRAFVTNAICAPSRAVILTGKHSHLNGVRNNVNVFD